MSRIEGYCVYQKNYYKDNIQDKKEQEAEKAKKTEKTSKNAPLQLSDRAKKLLKELRQTYGNMDFMVADYETEEEAAHYLSRGTKEYSVLIDPETLEQMAADEDTKKKYLGMIEEATAKFDDMKENLGEKKDEVVRIGVTIGKDGTVSYFAELEKMSEAQRERIEKAKEEKKEAKSEKAERREDRFLSEGTKKTKVQAASVEELLEKIKNVDWDSIKGEEVKGRESCFDYSV